MPDGVRPLMCARAPAPPLMMTRMARNRPKRAKRAKNAAGEEEEDEDDGANLSLAAMEAELRDDVMETLDAVASDFTSFRKLQDKLVGLRMEGKDLSKKDRDTYEGVREIHRRQFELAQSEQCPDRGAGRTAGCHQQAPGGSGGQAFALSRGSRRAAPRVHERLSGP